MKIAFLYPAFENLGIEYISSMLKKNGHSTFLAFDPQLFDDLFISMKVVGKIFDYKKRIIEQLKNEKPDLIFFSVVSDIYPWTCEMAQRIKKQFEGIPVVFGGPHVTAVPECVLVKPYVDYVIIGEGEYAASELVNALDAGLPINSIENIGYKVDGKTVINETRSLIQDLDGLPFPDTDLFLNQNPYANKEYNIITSRGCVHSCSYCHNSVERKVLWKHKEKYLRRRSVENVLDELKMRKEKYGFDTLCIWDEVFTYNINWLKEFGGRYKKEIGVPFWAFIHPNHVTEEIVQILEDIGCWEVEMGIQTLNPWVKKEILKRPENKEDIARAIDLFRKSKIRIVVDVIFGLPQLNEKDYNELINFFIEHTPSKIQTFWLRYYPKTTIIDSALKYNMISSEDVENIENGIISRAAASGGSGTDKKYEKYQTALTLLPYLPKKLTQNFVEKNWMRFLPRISGFGHLLTRAFDLKNRNDVGGRRYKGRMIHFCLKKIFPFLFISKNNISYDVERSINQ